MPSPFYNADQNDNFALSTLIFLQVKHYGSYQALLTERSEELIFSGFSISSTRSV